jgi:hypothetical protein
MTVSTTEYIARYTGSSPTVTFAFPYKFLEDDDLIVAIYNPTTYVTTLQTEGTDYTVTGAGLDSGGSITFTTAPTTGHIISIVRSTDITQLTDYVPDNDFSADSHEDAIDKLTLIAQENFNKLLDENGDAQGRALIYPASDAASISNVVPASELRPNLLFQWNNSSEPTTVAPASLNLVTLDNDPLLGSGSPSSLSGVTQLAVKTYIDIADAAIETGVGLNADGTYNAPSGSSYIDSSTSVMNALSLLDTTLKCVHNGAVDLNTREIALAGRVTTLENTPPESTFTNGTPSGSNQRSWTLTKPSGTKWLSLSVFSHIQGQSNGSASFSSATCDLGVENQYGNWSPGDSISIVIQDSLAEESFHYVPLNYVVVPVDKYTDSVTVTITVTGNNGTYRGYMEGKYG